MWYGIGHWKASLCLKTKHSEVAAHPWVLRFNLHARQFFPLCQVPTTTAPPSLTGRAFLEGGNSYFFKKKIFFITLRERGREREKHWLVAFWHAPSPGIKPATWVSALTRNWTHDSLVYGMTFQPTKPHGPGQEPLFYWPLFPVPSTLQATHFNSKVNFVWWAQAFLEHLHQHQACCFARQPIQQ